MVVGKKLIILRGLPGSGKSQIANKLLENDIDGNGIVHSTDSYLIKNGKYTFDSENIDRYHQLNLFSSIESMKKGKTPIIIDNTNIMAEHCAEYVKYGKIFGYNIEIIEANTPWAFDVEELIKRNRHDVPRETIVDMLQKYERLSIFKNKLGL